MVSDRGLLSWFSSYAAKTPSFQKFLTNSLHSFDLPSLNLYDAVIASTANSTVLDAMKLMSEEGVSSVAVLEDESGNLLSAVSVTDIGKVCPVTPGMSLELSSSLIKDRCPK
jgi:CBS domain